MPIFSGNRYPCMPRIIITFDDGWEAVYSKAFPIMQTYNLRGVAFVSPNKNTDPLYMSLEQQTTLYNSGWDISNHTFNHTNLGTATDEQMHTAINAADAILSANFPRSAKFFAYPYGAYKEITKTYLRNQGFHFARSTIETQYANQFDFNIDDPYLVQAMACRGGGVQSPAVIAGFIDTCIANKGLLVLYFHDFVDAGDGGNFYLTSEFDQVCAYVRAKVDADLLWCVTMSEYFQDYTVSYTAGTSMIRGLSHG